ncbi:MAG: transporter permease/ATP-binding protein [Alphaproteobacteria bacterium]|jgi:ATP-binding cassette subfamily B protein|nr:transporter permease/ATP-binding protein [Alphaproteobacteria bacterium]
MLVLKFIFKSLKPFKAQQAFFVMASVAWAIDLSLRPYLLKCALDSVALEINFENNKIFFLYIILYLLIMIFMFSIEIIYEYVWIKFFSRFKANIGSLIFKDLIDQSYAFYQNHFPGGLGNRLNNCIGSIPRIVKAVNEDFLRHLLAIIISAYTLHHIGARYSMALIIWVSVYMCCSIFLAPLVKERSIIASTEASRGMGYIIDILNNMISIKLFSSKNFEIKSVDNNFKEWERSSKDRDIILVHLYTLQSISYVIFQVICIYWMLEKNIQMSKLNLGDFILFLSISFSIYSCLLGLTAKIADYSENLGTVSEALNTIYSLKEIQDKPNAETLKVSVGQINFKNVKFHYKGIEPLFHNKSVEIKAGQKVGLVGYSGSGKSTFVNLILRLYDITGGAILIDGQDIRDVTQDSLHANIAMIPQEPSLFHRSLMDNIRYGKIEATEMEVIEAAKKAHAHEFITKLPQRYDSLVGERGIKLSGGQRQRIAIARAILKNALILILDEATSQLDSVTESLIQESLWELMQGKTTIIIAHRLSTLLRMDRILVFDKGKIVEEGTHHELLAKNGLYKRLWKAQVAGFLGDREKGICT